MTRTARRCPSVHDGDRCELAADHTGPHLAAQNRNRPATWWLSNEPEPAP